jgi:hypothetical protein
MIKSYSQRTDYQKKFIRSSKVKVGITEDQLRQVKDISESCLYNKDFSNSIRLWHRLVALTKANAFQHKRKAVTKNDIEKIRELSKYMNDRFTVI